MSDANLPFSLINLQFLFLYHRIGSPIVARIYKVPSDFIASAHPEKQLGKFAGSLSHENDTAAASSSYFP